MEPLIDVKADALDYARKHPDIGRMKLKSQFPLLTESMSQSVIRRARKGGGLGQQIDPPAKDEFVGLEGFREAHDMIARQERRDRRITELIKRFVDGLLKKRGWYYASDIPKILGISTADLERHSGEWVHLQVDVVVDRGRTTRERVAWCHPDIVDECRRIAERS